MVVGTWHGATAATPLGAAASAVLFPITVVSWPAVAAADHSEAAAWWPLQGLRPLKSTIEEREAYVLAKPDGQRTIVDLWGEFPEADGARLWEALRASCEGFERLPDLEVRPESP